MDRLALAYASSPCRMLLLWLLGSVLAYGFSTNAIWLVRSKGFRRSPYTRLLIQVGRFLFFVGVPYLTLGGWPLRPFQGILSLEAMGLVGLSPRWPVTRWLGAAGTGLGVGLVTLLFLVFAWRNANRATGGTRLYPQSQPWWALLINALYLQVHWAFYRSALSTLQSAASGVVCLRTGQVQAVATPLDDGYTGIFLGLALIYLEWSLNPAWRHAFGDAQQGWHSASQSAECRFPVPAHWAGRGGGGQWLHAALALITAMIFLLTRNLWVCLGIHWFLELVFWYAGRAWVQTTDAQNLVP
jgi:hypothetical protein